MWLKLKPEVDKLRETDRLWMREQEEGSRRPSSQVLVGSVIA